MNGPRLLAESKAYSARGTFLYELSGSVAPTPIILRISIWGRKLGKSQLTFDPSLMRITPLSRKRRRQPFEVFCRTMATPSKTTQ